MLGKFDIVLFDGYSLAGSLAHPLLSVWEGADLAPRKVAVAVAAAAGGSLVLLRRNSARNCFRFFFACIVRIIARQRVAVGSGRKKEGGESKKGEVINSTETSSRSGDYYDPKR